jgi:AraC-like DNA-binding protein
MEGAWFCQRLLAARGVTDVLEELQRGLLARLRGVHEPRSSRLARRAAALWEHNQNLRVEYVAQELGVTSRHLRRVFIKSVGVRPKEFARMARLQKAVRAARPSTDWTRVAVDTGYYDQSHLIADFRDPPRNNADRVHWPRPQSRSALRKRVPPAREPGHAPGTSRS